MAGVVLLQDLRYTIKAFVKSPGFAAVAIVTLALGIGSATALFTVVNGVLLNPLPFSRPEQLVAIYATTPGVDRGPVVFMNFLDWQRDARTLSSLAIYRNQDYNLTSAVRAERVSGYMISSGFFSTLDVQPILGRIFRPDDDRIGAAPVAIVGGGFWSRALGRSPSVIGTTLILNGIPFTIVGVVPENFSLYGSDRDVYTPIGQWNDPSFRDRRISVSAHAIGRLRPDVALAQAQSEMNIIAAHLAAAFPVADKDTGITLVPMKKDIVGDVESPLVVLSAAVGFLLLIACVNVANLLLARSVVRSREFAVRAALGADRMRLVRQLMTESVILAGSGGIVGVVFAEWATKAAIAALPGTLPRAHEIAVDGRVIMCAACLCLTAAVVFGLAPAMKSARLNLQEIMNESGGRSVSRGHGLQRLLVAVEIGMALVLLIGAGLMLQTLAALRRVDLGFNPSHAMTFNLSMPSSPLTTSAETRARLRQFDSAMQSIPGVEAVSVTLGSRPMIHDSSLPFWVEGRPKPANDSEMAQAMFYLVEAGFERAMDITLERGRFVTARDDEHSPIVVDIDDAFARSQFPGEDPIGKRVNLTQFNVQAEIVGVVGHIKQEGPAAVEQPALGAQFFYPFMQLPEKLMPLAAGTVAVVLRTDGDPTAIMGLVRHHVDRLDGRAVIYGVQTLDGVVAASLSGRTFLMMLLVVFAGLSLLLASVGVYGVIAYLFRQRTREIGLRMALGAQRRDVIRLVLAEGAAMSVVGVAAGIGVAFGLTRLMANQLFGVGAQDPLTFVAVAVLLMAVAVFACYLPARRAVRIDPLVALRCE